MQPVSDAGDSEKKNQSTIIRSRLWEHDTHNASGEGPSIAQRQDVSQTASLAEDVGSSRANADDSGTRGGASPLQSVGAAHSGKSLISARENTTSPPDQEITGRTMKRRRMIREQKAPACSQSASAVECAAGVADVPPILPPLEEYGDTVRISVRGQYISMRISDAWMNLAQLVACAHPNRDSNAFRDLLADETQRRKTKTVGPSKLTPWMTTWINYDDAQAFCHTHNILQDLRPLFDFGLAVNQHSILPQPEARSGYLIYHLQGTEIPVSVTNMMVNVTRIVLTSGRTRQVVSNLKRKHPSVHFERVRPGEFGGMYCDIDFAVKLCSDYGFLDLANWLRELTPPLPSLPSNSIDMEPRAGDDAFK